MSRRAETGSRGRAGFTLVEVMIGLVLLAMLMTVILTSIRLGTGIWSQAEARTDDQDAMTSVETLLRRTVDAAQPAFASADPSDRRILFSGLPDALDFVAPLPGSGAAGPWTSLDLHLIQDGPGRTLVLSWEEGQPPHPHVEPLLDQVTALRLDYFGPAAPGEAPQWHERWPRTDRLPALIRIRIERAASHLPPWPDIFLAPPVNANAVCVRDASGNGCRRMR
jgi:general secretion pathway protein J